MTLSDRHMVANQVTAQGVQQHAGKKLVNNNNKDTIHALASMPSAPRLMEADTTPSATSMSEDHACMHCEYSQSFLQKQSNGIVHNCTFIIPEIT